MGTKANEKCLNYIREMEKIVVAAYLFIMFAYFPLYYKNQYESIGTLKYEVFWNSSIFFIITMAVVFIVEKLLHRYRDKRRYAKKISIEVYKFSFLDKAVFAYGVCIIVSFLLSDYTDFALMGAGGWNMGLYPQLIFLALYYIFSRLTINIPKFIFYIHLAASGLTFLLGILHRFDIDPLKMYPGLTVSQKVQFLSTIGQATWFSSYICTVCCLGIAAFYFSEKIVNKVITGIYTILCFAILVTQNSDSAFIALFGVVLVLGYFSLSDIQRWVKFWQILAMMWGTFACMGILQRIFADRAIPLDSLSIFFSQSIATWILFIVCVGLYFIFKKRENSESEKLLSVFKNMYKVFAGILLIGIVGAVILIYLNTKGYLLEWFGFQSNNNYLLFNSEWGNKRGGSWSVAWQGFCNMPFINKLFGVGPDCFSEYLYDTPEIRQFLMMHFPDLTLTNAHNEYLNSLICYGIAGVAAWLTVLIGGVRCFYDKARENPFMIAFALCIVGYACHNFFCYQQVCCTPFLFILLGIGECLTKSIKSHTIK